MADAAASSDRLSTQVDSLPALGVPVALGVVDHAAPGPAAPLPLDAAVFRQSRAAAAAAARLAAERVQQANEAVQRAALAGDPVARLRRRMQDRAQDPPRISAAEADALLTDLAASGVAAAAHALAWCCVDRGDTAWGVTWFLRGACAGCPWSARALSYARAQGWWGLERDAPAALFWGLAAAGTLTDHEAVQLDRPTTLWQRAQQRQRYARWLQRPWLGRWQERDGGVWPAVASDAVWPAAGQVLVLGDAHSACILGEPAPAD
jgi:hypothetical protein